VAGIRTSYENGTFMTSQEAYREGIVAADNYAAINTWASPADRVAELGLDLAERVLIPLIRPDINGSVYTAGIGQPTNAVGLSSNSVLGSNSSIVLFARFVIGVPVYSEDATYAAGSTARLQVFAWGGNSLAEDPDAVNDHPWCLHSTHVISGNLQIRLHDIPAVPYMVLVNNMPAGTALDILEMHTE